MKILYRKKTTTMKKYQIRCDSTGEIIGDFKDWFAMNQVCPDGTVNVTVEYKESFDKIQELIDRKDCIHKNRLWRYFDFLPLYDDKNIISLGEGAIPVNRWSFLEDFARKNFDVNCKVFVYRNDENAGTGTFKDAAATLAASLLKENGVKEYVIASTGNIATAYSRYLSLAGVSLSIFIPENAQRAHQAEIGTYGQRIFKVRGDYATAKKVAAAYAKKNNILISLGNIDPIRVEAKRTMVFEWLRLMDEFPTVYIQALSGGTGPIAIEKGINEIKSLGLVKQVPRFILSQPHRCNPMAIAWEKAKAKGFPEGWLKDYPIINNPYTKIPTLSTGNPTTFPIIADIVKRSNGEILSFDEDMALDVARLATYFTTVKVGPAATVAIGGFFESLMKNKINNGDVVLINVGEGAKRSPEYMEAMNYSTIEVNSVDECPRFDRKIYEEQLWSAVEEKYSVKKVKA